jgi:hypothetical protein
MCLLLFSFYVRSQLIFSKLLVVQNFVLYKIWRKLKPVTFIWHFYTVYILRKLNILTFLFRVMYIVLTSFFKFRFVPTVTSKKWDVKSKWRHLEYSKFRVYMYGSATWFTAGREELSQACLPPSRWLLCVLRLTSLLACSFVCIDNNSVACFPVWWAFPSVVVSVRTVVRKA